MKYEQYVRILVRGFYIAPLETGARNCTRDGFTQSAAKYLEYSRILSGHLDSMAYGFISPQECLESSLMIYQRSKETIPPLIQQDYERLTNEKAGVTK